MKSMVDGARAGTEPIVISAAYSVPRSCGPGPSAALLPIGIHMSKVSMVSWIGATCTPRSTLARDGPTLSPWTQMPSLNGKRFPTGAVSSHVFSAWSVGNTHEVRPGSRDHGSLGSGDLLSQRYQSSPHARI